jgi:putative protein kinase ArgK-like GTPase of G3E family
MRRGTKLALVAGGATAAAAGGAIVGGRLRTYRSEHDVRGLRGPATFASCARGICALQ